MKKIIAITVLLSLFFSTIQAQGPWTKGKNKAYIQVGFSGIFYDKVRLNNEKTTLAANIADITSQLYTEYGITDNLDVTLILPYKTTTVKSKVGNNSESISGLGNVTLGLKYKFFDKNWKVSAGLFYSANSGIANEQQGLRTGYGANTFLPYITAGTSQGKIYYFANIGYGYMTNDYTDFLKIGGEFGYKFLSKTHLILNLELKSALSKEKYFDSVENSYFQGTTTYIDKQQFFGVGIKLNHEFLANKFGANIGAIGAISQNNLPFAPSFNVGVYYKL